jgi:hypothetical protein
MIPKLLLVTMQWCTNRKIAQRALRYGLAVCLRFLVTNPLINQGGEAL